MIMMSCPSLAKLTTLGLGGSAMAEIGLERQRDFEDLALLLERTEGEPRVLGGGSNILAQEGDLPVVLVRPLLGRDKEPTLLTQEGDDVVIRLQSGMGLPRVVAWCGNHGFSGLEGLVGIPGRVGGAIAMNAGAYGTEIGSTLRSVRIWSPGQGSQVLSPGDWKTGYRHFSCSGDAGTDKGTDEWFVITGADVALTCSSPEKVQATIRANLAQKKTTQPLGAHSAGCVFKNPPNGSAGKLLDEAGFRGRRCGGMWFTDRHANFLANTGKGRFAEAMELITEAREAVAARTGINLELEVKVWSWPKL